VVHDGGPLLRVQVIQQRVGDEGGHPLRVGGATDARHAPASAWRR